MTTKLFSAIVLTSAVGLASPALAQGTQGADTTTSRSVQSGERDADDDTGMLGLLGLLGGIGLLGLKRRREEEREVPGTVPAAAH
jgi:LPXTG-motif cell wall-anchored protein